MNIPVSIIYIKYSAKVMCFNPMIGPADYDPVAVGLKGLRERRREIGRDAKILLVDCAGENVTQLVLKREEDFFRRTFR